MKNFNFLSFVFTLCIIFQSCRPAPISGSPDSIDSFCEDLRNGTITMQINGGSWTSRCVGTSRILESDPTFTINGFTLIAYSNEGRFFLGSRVEAFLLSYVETTIDGDMETASEAGFFDDLLDISRIDNPDFDGRFFYSDDSPIDQIIIGRFTENGADGTFKMKLFEEDTVEEIEVEGTFDMVFDE